MLTYSSTPVSLYRCIIYVGLGAVLLSLSPPHPPHYSPFSYVVGHKDPWLLQQASNARRATGCKTFEMIRNGHRNAAV